ncbi:MAG: tRNA cyclic N6-threonylcarbamoyladenosine(37) synthase TcdA [Gammaproteobacteria bacterium]|nr:tRNA cyclic N6-threonylcarbamoyladenosine(37) synthase TcdA [Gammaproteobacteria bacterium]
MNSTYQQRFGGIERLYGKQLTQLFQEVSVTVIGIGGVGSWVVEALARSGFANINIIDFDDISESNINRQIHSLTETIGKPKVEVMVQRVKSINPECNITGVDDRLSETNIEKFFDPQLGLLKQSQYIIDAIDSVKPKTALLAYCVRHKIPVITTGGAGGLCDPTQVSFADLSKTYNDALAAKVRYNLRSQYNFSRNPKTKMGIECVYSKEQPYYPQPDGTVSYEKPKGVTLDCATGYGSSTMVTATFGFVAVSRLIEKLKTKN